MKMPNAALGKRRVTAVCAESMGTFFQFPERRVAALSRQIETSCSQGSRGKSPGKRLPANRERRLYADVVPGPASAGLNSSGKPNVDAASTGRQEVQHAVHAPKNG